MNIKNKIQVILVSLGLLAIVACEDLAFGDKFLQKPPSTDVTIDTVYSTAEYARRVLWYSYEYLPYGHETSGYWTTMWLGCIEGLTDLNQDYLGYSGVNKVYYAGNYNAGLEDARKSFMATKIRFLEGESHMWSAIRHAWLTVENIDRVPDMDAIEKSRLKAEAKMIVAIYYAHMLRHYGGLPLIHKALVATEEFPKRATLQETVDFTIGLLDEAIACPDFPWSIPEAEAANLGARMTKAGAMALKARVLLFVASPLYNSDTAFYPGAASEQKMTWFGNYDHNRWKAAVDACEAFFKEVNAQGHYRLVQTSDVDPQEYRLAFRKAYFDRNTPELLITVNRNIYLANNNQFPDQARRWGAMCPTKEYFDMFQTADGDTFDWNNPDHAKNPFINRDPRLCETFILDGDNYQGRKVQVTQEYPEDKKNYPAGSDWGQGQLSVKSLLTGLAVRKWGLDRGGEYKDKPIQWPHLRMAELYLTYAEALNEYHRGPNALAYQYVDAVRARVGLNGLKKGLSQEEFRAALLRERACEFGYEEVRFFDLIRWKMKEKFTTPLHGLNIYKHKVNQTYICEPFSLEGGAESRAWWKPGGFEEKWYLSAFPQAEINKGYGMVQNPGWE
ncbi:MULTISPECIES: RagB/SusD family nutrient uptake outer membrane protein [Bacteroides]|uniref:RagB/SusD family nutrient uptake outer membrane protein n=1 Tax=Bacteroides TaxID=816 RepID=UPI0004B388E9|nr:RagB/SusD family nutrient uptake outer membrane protein [Bacteroides neonati]